MLIELMLFKLKLPNVLYIIKPEREGKDVLVFVDVGGLIDWKPMNLLIVCLVKLSVLL